MDPPYGRSFEFPVLNVIRKSPMVSSEDILILETSLDSDTEAILDCGFQILREKRYKNQRHLFLSREEPDHHKDTGKEI